MTEFLTLDGVMEDPGGSEKTSFGGWSLKFLGDDRNKYKLDEMFEVDSMLLGRKTYEGFAEAWPTRKDEMGFADRMNGMQKYVFTNTLQNAEWQNSKIIKGNLGDEIAKLKHSEGGNILLVGSPSLAQALIKLDLVDELRLMVHPMILGEGRRLFGDGSGLKTFKLVDNVSYKSGTILLSYSRE